MIVTFNTRPFMEVQLDGYSTEQVEEEIDDERVSVYTNEEAEELGRVRGGAPRSIIETIEEMKDD